MTTAMSLTMTTMTMTTMTMTTIVVMTTVVLVMTGMLIKIWEGGGGGMRAFNKMKT